MKPDKQLILGVDYADDVEEWYRDGKLGDSALIEQIMDNAVAAGMTAVCWRVSHVGTLTYRTKVGTMQDGTNALRGSLTPFGLIMKRCDPLAVAVSAAHERGLKLYVYYTLFDEAFVEHQTGVVQESRFGRDHPYAYLSDRAGQWRVRGVLSFGYPEVRAHFAALVQEALTYRPDGIYLDLARTHAGANPIPVHGWWPQWSNPYLGYGYNEPDVQRYRERFGEEPPSYAASSGGLWQLGNQGPQESLEPGEQERNWNRLRGEALTTFLRELQPLFNHERSLQVCFFPTTYNGFNPGYQTRQMLGRIQLDWESWVKEGLIDGIRLNVDHRRFGYDDWVAASAATYKVAQERGVQVFTDCAIESRYDVVDNSPKPLPVSKREDPETFFAMMGEMTTKMLQSSADGVFFYEHAGNDQRTWQTIAAAKRGSGGPG